MFRLVQMKMEAQDRLTEKSNLNAFILYSILVVTTSGSSDQNVNSADLQLLRSFSKRISRPMVFQVPVLTEVYWPLFAQVPASTIGLKAIALDNKYYWQQQNGVQVFIQKQIVDNYGTVDNAESIFEIIGGLNQRQMYQIANEGIMAAGLPSAQRDKIGFMLGGQSGLAHQYLQREQSATIRVNLVPVIKYRSKDGSIRRFPISRSADISNNSEVSSTDLVANLGSTNYIHNDLEMSINGKMNLGEGQVLKLIDLVTLANRAFNVRYTVDPRLALSEFYVSGSLNQDSWELVHKTISDTEPGKRSYENFASTGTIVDALSKILLDSIENPDPLLELFMAGGNMSASELLALDPSLESKLRQLGLEPNSRIELSFGLDFEVNIPGYRRTGTEDGMAVLTKNSTSFFFGRN